MYEYQTLSELTLRMANGEQLKDWQIAAIRQKAERDIERAEKQRTLRRKRRFAFQEELVEILYDHPGYGFTATNLQFSMENFVERNITNQKVSAAMLDIAKSTEPKTYPDVEYTWVVSQGKRVRMWYVGKLCNGYRQQISRVIGHAPRED